MDSVFGWLALLAGSVWTLVALTKAVIAEADRKARAGEADWIRLETEWRR